MYHTSSCSRAYAELHNLKNAADFHKEHCQQSDCNVTLLSLKWTAHRLITHVWSTEKKAAIELVEQFPII